MVFAGGRRVVEVLGFEGKWEKRVRLGFVLILFLVEFYGMVVIREVCFFKKGSILRMGVNSVCGVWR